MLLSFLSLVPIAVEYLVVFKYWTDNLNLLTVLGVPGSNSGGGWKTNSSKELTSLGCSDLILYIYISYKIYCL